MYLACRLYIEEEEGFFEANIKVNKGHNKVEDYSVHACTMCVYICVCDPLGGFFLSLFFAD